MKKKNDSFLLGSLIAGVVSALCLQGMKLVDKKWLKMKKRSPDGLLFYLHRTSKADIIKVTTLSCSRCLS